MEIYKYLKGLSKLKKIPVGKSFVQHGKGLNLNPGSSITRVN